jgi:exodeoxyribonuclease-3
MRIATYNVNGISARLPVLLKWLETSKPNVACLQELKAPDEKFPYDAIRAAGYDAIWHGQKSWNGVAILSNLGKPVEIAKTLKANQEDAQSRYIEGVVNGIRIGCIYLPNGNPIGTEKFNYKLNWMDKLYDHAAEMAKSKEPVVLCGDYNVIPTDLDAYKPEHWKRDALFQPESKEAFQRLLSQGWTDSIRTLYSEEQIFTFWDYFRKAFERNAGIRIDHLLLNKALAPRLQGGGVDKDVRGWEKSSDHAPVWIKIKDE